MDRCVNAHEVEPDPLPLQGYDVLAGRPVAAGVVRDVEADEVLAGDATVRFETGESIELAPGVVVRLHAGERTEWEVRSPVRKVYVVAG